MSSYNETDDVVPTYFNIADEMIKKAETDSNIPMYAVIDKSTKCEDSTYDELKIHSEDKEIDVSMENDKVKKSLSESLCDKRFLCLLVAIIVIIVTFCTCFLLAFLQISQLRSEKSSFQVSNQKLLSSYKLMFYKMFFR